LPSFVLDCSVTLPWFFEDETDGYADAILHLLAREEATAPALWPLEVVNGLVGAERRGRLSTEDVTNALAMLAELDIAVEQQSPMPTAVLTVAREYRLTAYDAAYLELAMRENLPLATNDRDLAEAAKRAGAGTLVVEDIRPG
jgi:predicted nucleic acid-binding protein